MFPFFATENLSPVFTFLNLQVIIFFLIDYPLISIVFTLPFFPILSWTFPPVKGLSTAGGFLLVIILKTEGRLTVKRLSQISSRIFSKLTILLFTLDLYFAISHCPSHLCTLEQMARQIFVGRRLYLLKACLSWDYFCFTY